jgi:hypothetical protein
MKPVHILIFLIAVIVVGLMGVPMAVAETINTQDYWVLSDGYSEEFTNNGEVTVSYGPYIPYIVEDVFDVDWPGSTGATHQFFHYDSGALKYYGARFQDALGGDSWVYVPSSAQDFLPSVLEVGKSYTSAWSRSEYKNGTYQGLGSDSYTITVTGPNTTTVSAGTFTTYQLAMVNEWQTSVGSRGTTNYTYYLASDTGWVKMSRGGVAYELKSQGGKPSAPRLSVSTSGVTLSLSWTAQTDAEGYTLFYAPYPGVESIGTIDMEAEMGGSFGLWEGAAFYLAVQAYNGSGSSGFSNIEYFIIGDSLSVTPSSLSLSVGQTGSCTISGGTGSYSATSSNTSVATVSVSGGTLYVTGASAGAATITVRDSGGDSGTVSVNVSGDILTIDTGGADLDSDGVIDIRYVSEDFGGAPGPFLAAEGGFQCGVGSGNRLSSPSFVNFRYCTEYPEAYNDVVKAPDYVPGSDSEGTYFTYFGTNLSETLVARSYSGNRYFKILLTRVDEVECEFIWKEIDPPSAETCTPGTAGLNELGLFCIPPP